MPAPAGNDFMTTLRINTIRKDIQDARTTPVDLKFLNRLNRNPVPNSWLTAKWKGNRQIADLIAPNAPGVAYQASRIYTETGNTQNMRVGTAWSADQVEEYYTIRNAVTDDPEGIFANGLFHQTMMDQIVGHEWRMEWLSVAMATDGFYGTSSYNRLGIAMTGVDGRTPTWGMKPDMKTFVQTPLGNPDGSVNVNCPIIDYIFQMMDYRQLRYGKTTNRITMRTATKRAAQKTLQFQQYAARFQLPFYNANAISPADYPELDKLLARILDRDGNGLELVTYDSVYQTESGDGSPAQYVPFLPLAPEACMILDDSRNDRNDSVHDFGIGTTMESRADSLRYTNGEGFPKDLPAGKPGMFTYMDMPTNMNPVQFAIWTVCRGWPRKVDEVCEAVLFLGPLADSIPVTDIAIV